MAGEWEENMLFQFFVDWNDTWQGRNNTENCQLNSATSIHNNKNARMHSTLTTVAGNDIIIIIINGFDYKMCSHFLFFIFCFQFSA